ncbi:uncharacterized protein LOC121314558 isoform X5 [Polyodon spathula]|uniref:uncharacterized protein LOC121314558 isoform X5 n=1 Tax=Polyodon spathula TaxID=7913 RepID=UPI001B7E7EDD|nr:uncharacterized protein LOC121314558 isoform X5 [Polyodon spathula]
MLELEEKLRSQTDLKKSLETVWRLLSKTINNILAQQMNWTGVNGKRAFKNPTLKDVVFDVTVRERQYRIPESRRGAVGREVGDRTWSH